MTVCVQLFAGARELAGADEVRVDVIDGGAFADLSQALAAACPALGDLLNAAKFAQNAAYVSPEQPVDPAAEIALIPPVSGG